MKMSRPLRGEVVEEFHLALSVMTLPLEDCGAGEAQVTVFPVRTRRIFHKMISSVVEIYGYKAFHWRAVAERITALLTLRMELSGILGVVPLVPRTPEDRLQLTAENSLDRAIFSAAGIDCGDAMPVTQEYPQGLHFIARHKLTAKSETWAFLATVGFDDL